jgi:hypothetical protein
MIIAYWAIFMIFVICGIVGYLKALSTLNDLGHDSSIQMLPSAQHKQAKQYKQLCLENGLPMGWAKFLTAFPYIGALLIFGWLMMPLIVAGK